MLKTGRIRPIARKRRNFIYLLLAVLFLISSLYIFFNFSPDAEIHGIPILPIFIFSGFLFLFFTISFVFNNKTQGFLIPFFILLYLVLRLFDLSHLIFLGLVVALFITAELFLLKQK